MPENKKRNWVVCEPDGTEHGRHGGRNPRAVVKRLAARSSGTKESPVGLRIREKGTSTIRLYMIWKEIAPNRPPWCKKEFCYEGHFKFIGIQHVEKPHHSTLLKQEREERERLAAQESPDNAAAA